MVKTVYSAPTATLARSNSGKVRLFERASVAHSSEYTKTVAYT